jgi:hypothetical protein
MMMTVRPTRPVDQCPSPARRVSWTLVLTWAMIGNLLVGMTSAWAQLPGFRQGEVVPRDVREMYDRGLQYLVQRQSDNGAWEGDGQQGPGVNGLCLMVLLASGEDPNFGLYGNPIRKALRNIIQAQDPVTGYMGSSMYHHGFAMLALAEAYGTVDDRELWRPADAGPHRSIGAALELAVRMAVTSQKNNPLGAWRYSPEARDADTSVSGAVLVGLLAARNAGIEVPDESIDRGIAYFKSMTSTNGQVAYAGGLGGFNDSMARTSIAALVFAIARRTDLPEYEATVRYLTGRLEQTPNSWADYTRYYQAQALFQGDVEAWEKWNRLLVRRLKEIQQADGGFPGDMGTTIGTSMSLLALALNYRFLPIYER